MNNDDLQAFICTWDTVLSGLLVQPEKSMLEALLTRQIRGCEAMEQDLTHYDRLAQDDPDRSYDYLLRCCRRVIERNRLTRARTELSKSIASGGRALVTKEGKDRPRGNSKGKGKKVDAEGNHRQDRPKEQRSQSQDKVKNSNVCTFHLRGRCKAGDKCPKKHKPPCKFVKAPGGC